VAVTGAALVARWFPGYGGPLPVVHRWSSYALVALGALDLVMWWRRSDVRLPWAVPAAAVLALTAAAAFLTSALVQWDQAALWLVDGGGFDSPSPAVELLFSDDVRFFIFGSSEISVEAVRAWSVTHFVAAPLIAALAVGVLARAGRR
jgi:hypothetical protein